MKRFLLVSVGLAGLLSLPSVNQADQGTTGVHLVAGQKDFLALEPILVSVEGAGKQVLNLPAGPDQTLRFDVKPALKPRSGAKPLPLEGRVPVAGKRIYDLLEWFQFPAQGTFTVQAVLGTGANAVRSEPISITIHRPGKDDPEAGPVDRLHHTPWSNYVTDRFCGDTFDLVQRWPDSKLARYCHYYNGLFHQHKKEYDKAVASFRTVLAKYPDFVLADNAQYGLAECLAAQGKAKEAAACLEKQRARAERIQGRAVQHLNLRLSSAVEKDK
jgi:hypothetical protein